MITLIEADDVTFWLANVARQLAMVATAEIEAHVDKCRKSIDDAERLGSFMDPMAYRRDCDNGTIQDCKNQLDIAKHLLAARKAIDVREEFVAKNRRKT